MNTTREEVQQKHKRAHELGMLRGREAAQYSEPHGDETPKEAAFKAEQNARQYASHMPQWIHDNRDFFEKYRLGVRAGIEDALRA